MTPEEVQVALEKRIASVEEAQNALDGSLSGKLTAFATTVAGKLEQHEARLGGLDQKANQQAADCAKCCQDCDRFCDDLNALRVTQAQDVSALGSKIAALQPVPFGIKVKVAWATFKTWLPTLGHLAPWALVAVLLLNQHGCTLPWPAPGPGPNPPGPDPGPTPVNPIPEVKGLHVLIWYDGKKVTPDLDGIISGSAVRDYLLSKCALDEDGKTRAFKIWPIGTDFSNAESWTKAVMQRHPNRDQGFMVVGNGVGGYDGPVPGTVADAMAILKKWGGS